MEEPILKFIREKNNELEKYILSFRDYTKGKIDNITDLSKVIDLIISYNNHVMELKNVIIDIRAINREKYIDKISSIVKNIMKDNYNQNIESNNIPNILADNININYNNIYNFYIDNYLLTYKSIVQKYNEINKNYEGKDDDNNNKLVSDYLIININLIILYYNVKKYLEYITYNNSRYDEIINKKIEMVLEEKDNIDKVKIIINNIILATEEKDLYKMQKIFLKSFAPNSSIILPAICEFEKKYKINGELKFNKDDLITLFSEILYDSLSL